MRCAFLWMLCWGCPWLLSAQSKLNIDLYRWWRSIPEDRAADTSLPLLVQGDSLRLRELVQSVGGQFKYQAGDIASVQISAQALGQLIEQPGIRRLEAYFAPLHSFYEEDSAVLYNNNISPAHQGWGDLPHGFRGEGVLVGVIDDGFDWSHPDFRYADGRTRVRYLWDQNNIDACCLLQPFGYGRSWDSLAIQNGNAGQIPGEHGTHVAGIAAGNGLAANKYIGVAPESNLLWVKILGGGSWMTGFVDGLQYMIQKADELNMPCAMNSSLGTYGSGHDGKDLYAQLVDNLISDRPGRVFVQAAGNAREYRFHTGVTVTDTAYSWFKQVPQTGVTQFYLYADTADFNDLDFSLQWIHGSTQQELASTPWFNVLRDLPLTSTVATLSQVLFYDNQGFAHTLQIFAAQYEGTYEMLVQVFAPTNSHFWQFKTKGQGKYSIWSHPSLMGTSEIVDLPISPRYRRPDDSQSLAGFWNCAESVITVGAYYNQSYLINYEGDTTVLNAYQSTYPTRGIWRRSSWGTTRDGRLKPNLNAPGGQVVAAASVANLLNLRDIGYDFLDVDGWHVSNQGTSMAAPMVAGAAALYLQCQPQATQAQVMQALQASARVDSFVLRQTGSVPNVHWGHGKLDVFQLLQSCLVYGCTDTAAVNYNPWAMVDDSSCIVFPPVAVKRVAPVVLELSPNPVHSQASLRFPASAQEQQLALYTAQGQLLEQHLLPPVQTDFHWSRAALPAGSYFWVLQSGAGAQAVKMVVW